MHGTNAEAVADDEGDLVALLHAKKNVAGDERHADYNQFEFIDQRLLPPIIKPTCFLMRTG